MSTTIEALPQMARISKTSKERKQRSDSKMTTEAIAAVERGLKTGLTQEQIAAITGVNRASISTTKLVLTYAGRLQQFTKRKPTSVNRSA